MISNSKVNIHKISSKRILPKFLKEFLRYKQEGKRETNDYYLTKYIDEHYNCVELRKFVGLNNLATPTMVIVSGTGVKLAHYTPRDFESIRRPLGETALEGELETLLDQYEIASSS